MATRTIMTCDLCKEEIKPGCNVIYLTAQRWAIPTDKLSIAGFDNAEFCGEACAVAAVRALLNGND